MIVNLPNILTLVRIVFIPPILILIWIDEPVANVVALCMFFVSCVTDFLDGYFARTWDQISEFGKTMDPIADKLLISLCLLVLVGLDRIPGIHIIPACIILSREIIVSGLREFLSTIPVTLPVSRAAKWKTLIQMVAVGFLITGRAFEDRIHAQFVGLVLLWGAAFITLVSAYDYLKKGFLHIQKR